MLRILASFLVMLVFALSVTAQSPQSTPPQNNDARAPGTISGRVVNENGQPLPNALVSVRRGNTPNAATATTDREGAFQVDGLDPGAYTVSAFAPSYTTPPREDSNTPPPTYRPGDSVNLTLIRGGVVTGTVINAAGEPVVGIAVRVQMIRDPAGRVLQRGAIRERTTDDRGLYRVYGLTSGTYVVSAGGPTEYSNSNINAFENDVATYAPSSGRADAAQINVRTGEEVNGIDIRYRAEQGRTISGEVKVPTDNSGFTVTLVAAGEGEGQWSTNSYQNPGTSNFVFNGIADGDYDVYARSYASQTGEQGVSEQKRISVRGADITGIVLTVKLFGSIAGRLVLEETTVPQCTETERPTSDNTRISAWHNDNEAAKRTPQTFWAMGQPTPPGEDGNFVLQNLAPGEYFFVARTQTKYWYLRSVSLAPPPAAPGAKAVSKPVDASRVWTNVKAGSKISGLTITLANGGAALRGRLALGEGEQKPPRLVIYLVPAERERAEDVLRFFATQALPDAGFAFNNVPPGRYWLMAQSANENDGPSLLRIRFPHETALRTRIRRDAEAVKNEIELKPCQGVLDFRLPLKPPAQ